MEQVMVPHHERIGDEVFRRAVELLDAGDVEGLRAWLREHPAVAKQRVVFAGEGYFRNPPLLGFIAENPVRHGTMPGNIVEIAKVILDAGVDQTALDETLGLVATGRVARESKMQTPLIDLLCDRGAEAQSAIHAAAAHGEAEAVQALIRRGACEDLAVAAALGDVEKARRLLSRADAEERQRALAVAAHDGQVEIVRMLLDAGEDPNRYNPSGFRAHSTPLHEAAHAGHGEVVRLLIERGARVDIKDKIWQGTAADWAEHGGHPEIEKYLREERS